MSRNRLLGSQPCHDGSRVERRQICKASAATFGQFDLIKPPRHGVFVEALTTGDRGGKHRVVYSDITEVRSN